MLSSGGEGPLRLPRFGELRFKGNMENAREFWPALISAYLTLPWQL